MLKRLEIARALATKPKLFSVFGRSNRKTLAQAAADPNGPHVPVE